MKDEGTIVIQFGSLLEQIEVNTASFTLPKTFKAKEGKQVPSDTKSQTSKKNDPEVKFPEFTLYECDLV